MTRDDTIDTTDAADPTEATDAAAHDDGGDGGDGRDGDSSDGTSSDDRGCGPESLGLGLITVGLVVSLAIPLAFLVGWIPVVIGIVILKRRSKG